MAISITITADTQEEAIHQVNGLADLLKQGADSLYFQQGTPRGLNAMTMVRSDTGNDYVLGGLMDKDSPKQAFQLRGPKTGPGAIKENVAEAIAKELNEAPQETAETAPKSKAKKSAPKEEKPAEDAPVEAEKHSIDDLRSHLATLSKGHKDDIRAILAHFGVKNMTELSNVTKSRDDGQKMLEEAYTMASDKIKEYGL